MQGQLARQTMGTFSQSEWYTASARRFMLLAIMAIRISGQADCGGGGFGGGGGDGDGNGGGGGVTPTDCEALLCVFKPVSSAIMTYTNINFCFKDDCHC